MEAAGDCLENASLHSLELLNMGAWSVRSVRVDIVNNEPIEKKSILVAIPTSRLVS